MKLQDPKTLLAPILAPKNLLSDGAREHQGREAVVGEAEVEGLRVVLPHDVHVDQVLHVVLLQRH